MNAKLKEKAVGFYFLIVTAVIGIVSLIRFIIWAPAHNAMDTMVVAAIVIGLILNVILFVKDHDFLIVLMTASYSVATVRILTDSVGSFVDAFQGINMFGDAAQVGTIVSISAVLAVGVLLSIIASFLKRVK